jgi:hypothetical protein
MPVIFRGNRLKRFGKPAVALVLGLILLDVVAGAATLAFGAGVLKR